MFKLGDALVCAPALPSLPHLSLELKPSARLGSTYAALTHGRIDADRLRDLLAACLPDAPAGLRGRRDHLARCDAQCSSERGYYYHPSRHSAGQPIAAGWAWQWIAQLSFDRDSWTAPVDGARLHPLDDADQTAAAQIRVLLGRMPASEQVLLDGDARVVVHHVEGAELLAAAGDRPGDVLLTADVAGVEDHDTPRRPRLLDGRLAPLDVADAPIHVKPRRLGGAGRSAVAPRRPRGRRTA